MSQAGDHVVVDAGQGVHTLREAVNTLQAVVAENVTLFHFQRQDHIIGAAEGIAKAVVQLNVGMLLR